MKKYIDSLRLSINAHVNNTSKADAYFLLSNYYKNTDTLLSKQYLTAGKNAGGKDPLTEAIYEYYEGIYYQDLSKEKATESFRKAIEKLSGLKARRQTAIFLCPGIIMEFCRKIKRAYPFLIKTMLEKSIPIAEKYGDSKLLGFLYSQLALMLTYNAEFEKADYYNKKALQILEKKAEFYRAFLTYLNTNSNYCYQAKCSMESHF
jgi:tetratricopeptide (TPR) repeat protein